MSSAAPQASRPRLLGLALLASALLSGACVQVSFHRDWDPEADFEAFRTYALLEAESVGGQEGGLSPLDRGRVVDALHPALGRAGLAPAEAADADLLVDVRFITDERFEIDSWGPGFGATYGSWSPSWGFYGGTQRVTVDHRLQGTLVLDFLERSEGRLVWRGWAVRDVERFDRLEPEQRRAEFTRLVEGILGPYPPTRREPR